MAHLSLYRKYRPDTFDKIVRQEHVVRVLRNQIATGAVGHAYLFTGPRGTGKTSVARIFARAVNCERPVNGSPCGTCPTCVALNDSLDISEIDAASNNGVNEMRDLREKVQYPPVTGKYKVYIVDEVHMLTDSAFNALLKTLEEPPAHVIFILATTEPQKIPATILSRCMRLDFKLIPEEDLKAHLKRIFDELKKPYEEEAIAAIARAGAGSDRDMLSIAEACMAYDDNLTYDVVCNVLGAADFTRTARLVSAMLSSDMPSAISLTEEILGEGKSVGVLLRDLLQLLRRVTVCKTCKNAEKLLALPASMFEEVNKIARKADGGAILRATEILITTENELRFVSSPRISLEAAIMRVSYPQADASADALLLRVKQLEEKLARASVPAASPAQEMRPAEVRPAQETRPAEQARPAQETRPAPAALEEEGEFPMEEPNFEEFSMPTPAPAKPRPAEPRPAQETRPAPEARPIEPHPAQPAPSALGMPAEVAFGKFMRALRKTSANGVLFTMCSDLIASYDGETLVLGTESETIYASLKREEHRAAMERAMEQIGIASFDVRLMREPPKPRDALGELKKDFGDYPIEFKS